MMEGVSGMKKADYEWMDWDGECPQPLTDEKGKKVLVDERGNVLRDADGRPVAVLNY